MNPIVFGYNGLIGSNLIKLGGLPAQSLIRHAMGVAVNAVGFTDVDACETNPVESHRSNVDWVFDMVESVSLNDFYCIHLSSDFIFNGRYGPYSEISDPSPISVYGAQKWIAETLVRTVPKHLIIRTTCVYGWHPKKQTFAHWVKKMCETDKPFYVTTEQCTTPTYAPDLARIIMQLIEKDAQGIVNVVGPEYMDRYTLACEIAEAFGYDPDMVKPVKHVEQVARRPLNGGLITRKLNEEYELFPQPLHESLKEMVEIWGR